jgi:hypothetical protein
MYCWLPCYGGGCGGSSLPQNYPIGGTFLVGLDSRFSGQELDQIKAVPVPQEVVIEGAQDAKNYVFIQD